MLKRLAMALAIITTTIPVNVYALGLGSIELESALNQPLNARIPLMRVRAGELKEIKINLASPETFQRAGIDYPSYLSQLKFEVISERDKDPYIKIISTQPITEPFLNFLLEVNWSSGRLLREFTVLVDPPVLVEGESGGGHAVESPTTAEQPSLRETIVEEAPAPRVVESRPSPARDVEEAVETPRSRPSPAPSTTTTTTRVVDVEPEVAPTPRRASSQDDTGNVKSLPGGGAEYRTQRGDTLWQVAESMRGESGLTVHQIMIALLRTNPEAFYRNNINNLKMGYVLRLEDFEWAAAISSDEAVRVADAQWQEWKQVRSSMVGSAPSSARTTRTASADKPAVKLLSPGEGSADATSAPRSASLGGSSTGNGEQLSLATEALDTSRRENTELRDRLNQVEQQVTTMERLIQLKDDQLQTLQQELGKPAPAVESKAPPTAAPAEPAPEEAAPVEPAKVEKPQAVKKPAAPVTPTAPQAAEEGIIDTILGVVTGLISNIFVLGGIGGIVLLGVVGWLVARRKKMQSFQESILTGKSSLGDDSADISASEDASFMSDFAVSTMEGIHADVDEVDPLSEADVYLAYGRYKQAEELINDALAKETRPELQMKLMEILHAAKDKKGFEAKARAFQKDLSRDPDMWSQVCHWGGDLNPDNPLFSGSGGGGGAAPAAGDDTLAEFGDFNLGDVGDSGATETFDLDMDLGLGEASEAASGGLDFDLDSFDSGAPASADDNTLAFNVDSASAPASAGDGGLDFNLDMDTTAEAPAADGGLDFNMDLDTGAGDDAPAHSGLDFNLDTSSDADDNTLNFSMDMDTADAAHADSDGGLDFQLDDSDEVGADSSNVVDFSSAATAGGAGDETTAFSLDEDFDADIDDSLFADVDEVGTKLDLAKAYIDMGDSDGAKSILDEVVEEGDATQKEEAKELMRQIG